MINGLGAFAGGLAQGLGAGRDIRLRQQYISDRKKSGQRKTELYQAKMDRLQDANDEIVADWQRNRQVDSAQPAQPAAPGLSGVSVQTPLAADTGAAGLSSPDKPITRPLMSSNEMIGMRMLTGKLLEDPDELTRMAGIYKKHGLWEEMAPWMNQVYSAKKNRIPEALHLLLSGDAKGAREILENGGVTLSADPVRMDEGNKLWKFRFENHTERDINLQKVAMRFFPSPLNQSGAQALP